jgi:hypothetical protein
LSGGELILTTGQQLRGAPDLGVACREYADRLAKRGACGLVFTLAEPDAGFAEALRAGCADVGLPLAEAPYRTPYLRVSEIIADAGRVLPGRARAAELHSQHALTLAALDRNPVQALVRELGMLLGSDILLLRADGTPVAETQVSGTSTPAASGTSSVTPRAAGRPRLAAEAAAARVRLSQARRPAPIRMPAGALAAPVMEDGGLCGVLMAGTPRGGWDAAGHAMLTFNTATAMLQLAWLRLPDPAQSSAQVQAQRIGSEVVRLLLDREPGRARELAEALPGASQFEPGTRLPDRVRLVLGSATDMLPAGSLMSLRTEAERLGVYPPGELPHTQGQALSGPMAQCADVPLEWVADAVAGLRRARAEAGAAGGIHPTGEVLTLSSPRALVLLHGIRDRSDSAQLLGAIRQTVKDALPSRTARELRRTVRIWCDSACSASAAAQQLGVHRTTVTRSLRRFETVTGLNLAEAGDRLLAWAACAEQD